MCAKTFSPSDESVLSHLDDTAQCHMDWTRRLLRCAVLRTAPGDDVVETDAHRRCRLGTWLQRDRERLQQLDAVTVQRLVEHHEQVHAAARSICRRILAGEPGNAGELEAFERAQAGVVTDLAQLKTAFLERSARLDALTGLPLRYGIEEEFGRCRAQSMRHGEVFVALMLDLDHFKRVNDARGHAAGDRALQHVADVLRRHCRAGEPVFRFGGEEFLAMLQAADRDAAERAVERILQALRESRFALSDGRPIRVTASAGLAAVGPVEPVTDAIARADRALYAAKAAGRDTWRWAVAAH
jgi:diguanylate cyclase (GGDEF)-like protein